MKRKVSGGSSYAKRSKSYRGRRRGGAARGGVQAVRVVKAPFFRQIKQMPLPNIFSTSLRYCSNTISLDPGVAGLPAQNVFAANGLYDPDITGTGHQPMGFDQLIAIYATYTVTASRIMVMAYNKSTDTSQLLGINVGNDSSLIYASRAIEQGEGVWKMLGPRGSNTEIVVLYTKYSLKKEDGPQAGVGNNTYQGSNSSNPTSTSYYNVWVDPNNATNTTAVDITVVIDYNVTFTNQIEMAQS